MSNTLEEIKNEVAIDHGYASYQEASDFNYRGVISDMTFGEIEEDSYKLYAIRCVVASLEKASKIVYDKYNGSYECKQDINNPDNIVIL